jgi:predicted acylesterase/phospholipase RssA
VLVESAAERTPVGTEPWLRQRPVEMCHHLHLEWRSHFARLARFIVGAPVGLVLSGGAARAFAHIGVLRALRDAPIPIDIVIGTSAGSLIGGQFAMGWSPERIEQVSAEVFGGPKRRLLDFVPPYTSLIGSTGFNATLDTIFGDVRFEDLWIQFLCTTTDLTLATGITHRRGRLRPFVRASCSLPMVMPPVTHEGHLLADGGIVNNVPVDPLLEVASVGMLVVVNVTSPFYTADEAYNYHDSLSIRRVLNGRFNPFAEKLVAPGILDVLLRSLEIGSKGLEPAQIAKATVYVRPDVSRFGYTDIAALPDIVAAGEREAVAGSPSSGRPPSPSPGPRADPRDRPPGGQAASDYGAGQTGGLRNASAGLSHRRGAVWSVKVQPKSGAATAAGSKTSSPAGFTPSSTHSTRSTKVVTSSVGVKVQCPKSRVARWTSRSGSPLAATRRAYSCSMWNGTNRSPSVWMDSIGMRRWPVVGVTLAMPFFRRACGSAVTRCTVSLNSSSEGLSAGSVSNW